MVRRGMWCLRILFSLALLACGQLPSWWAPYRHHPSRATTGEGVRVAVFDTGVDPAYNEVSDALPVRVISLIKEGHEAGCGLHLQHGTKTVSLIAGNLTLAGKPAPRAWRRSHPCVATDPSTASTVATTTTAVAKRGEKRFVGVAPRAEVTVFRVFSGGHAAVASEASILEALELMLNASASLPYHVLALPLGLARSGEATTALPEGATPTEEAEEKGDSGRPPPPSSLLPSIDSAIGELVARGVVVIAAAGNGGPHFGSLSPTPGGLPFVITVGESAAGGGATVWSSRGQPSLLTCLCPVSQRGGGRRLRDGGHAAAEASAGCGDALSRLPPVKPDLLDSFDAFPTVAVGSVRRTEERPRVGRWGAATPHKPPPPPLLLLPSFQLARGTSRATAIVAGVAARCVEAIEQEVVQLPPDEKAALRRRFLNTAFLKHILRASADRTWPGSHLAKGAPTRSTAVRGGRRAPRSREAAALDTFLHLQDGEYGQIAEVAGAGSVNAAKAEAVARRLVRRAVLQLQEEGSSTTAGYLVYAIPESIDVRRRRRQPTTEKDSEEGGRGGEGDCRWWWPQCEQPLKANAPPRAFAITVHTNVCPSARLLPLPRRAAATACGGGKAKNEPSRPSPSSSSPVAVGYRLERWAGYGPSRDGPGEPIHHAHAGEGAGGALDIFVLPSSSSSSSSSDVASFSGELTLFVRLAEAFVRSRAMRSMSEAYTTADVEGALEVRYQCTAYGERAGEAARVADPESFTLSMPFAFTIDLTSQRRTEGVDAAVEAGAVVPQDVLLDSSGIGSAMGTMGTADGAQGGLLTVYLYLSRVLGHSVTVIPLREWFTRVSAAEVRRYLMSAGVVIAVRPRAGVVGRRTDAAVGDKDEESLVRSWSAYQAALLEAAGTGDGRPVVILLEAGGPLTTAAATTSSISLGTAASDAAVSVASVERCFVDPATPWPWVRYRIHRSAGKDAAASAGDETEAPRDDGPELPIATLSSLVGGGRLGVLSSSVFQCLLQAFPKGFESADHRQVELLWGPPYSRIPPEQRRAAAELRSARSCLFLLAEMLLTLQGNHTEGGGGDGLGDRRWWRTHLNCTVTTAAVHAAPSRPL